MNSNSFGYSTSTIISKLLTKKSQQIKNSSFTQSNKTINSR